MFQSINTNSNFLTFSPLSFVYPPFSFFASYIVFANAINLCFDTKTLKFRERHRRFCSISNSIKIGQHSVSAIFHVPALVSMFGCIDVSIFSIFFFLSFNFNFNFQFFTFGFILFLRFHFYLVLDGDANKKQMFGVVLDGYILEV